MISHSGKAVLLLSIHASAQSPAFPGAEGFGGHAQGGRGGDVYTVTNLNANGAGSLREGIDTAPNSGRTIVFAVSGYIPLPGSNLRIVQPNITIAGQTAPGDGIGLRDGTVRITGNNTIIRNLRIRHGKNGGGGDCLNVDSSAHDSIIDHVSMQFSTDENISFFNSTLDKFTMQRSLSAWGLESHNAGGLWDLDHGSCIDSLWAHHHTRNPKARPYGLLEWINNVTFDWGIGFIMGDSQTPAPWKANVIGSYFLSPPTYTDNYALEKATVDRNGNPNFSIHLDDCLHDADGDGLLNGTDKGYSIIRGSEFQPGDPSGANRYVKSATPFTGSAGNIAVSIDDPLTAYKKVLSQAGAVRMSTNHPGPLRDEVDTLLFQNVANQVHSRISRESDLPVSNNGFGTLETTAPPTDTDLDGMPDFWESALGSDPNAQDHNVTFGNTAGTFFPPGTPTDYTYLEEYLHFKSIPHGVVAKNTTGAASSITIDLRRYTSGFATGAAFGISTVSNGSIQQFAANAITPSGTGPIVRFTPALNHSGRAGFDFTVDDGSTWSQSFALLVTVTAPPRDIHWEGGTNGNTWDTSTPNWATDTATSFNDGDNTLFDDRGNAAPIPLDGNRAPNTVTITGTKHYHFAGPGSLAVATSLTKASDTTLTLSANISATTGTYLNGGETIILGGGNLSGGPIRFTGGSTLTDNTPSYFTLSPDVVVDAGAVGNLNLSPRIDFKGSLSGGGTFNIFSPSTLGTEGRAYLDGASAGCTGTVNLAGGATAPGNGGRISFRANGGAFDGFPNARVHLSGIDLFTTNNSYSEDFPYAIGELAGDSNSRLRSNYLAGGDITIWSVGHLGTDSEFAGEIMDGIVSATELRKYGSGTLTLSGDNSHSGTTSIHAGGIHLTGSLANSTSVHVESGATLDGSGSIGGDTIVRNGAMLAGSLDITGATILDPGASASPSSDDLTLGGGIDINGNHLHFDLTDSPAGDNGRLHVAGGSADLSGDNTFHIRFADGVLGDGSYELIDCDAGVPLNRVGGMNMYVQTEAPPTIRQTFSIHRSASGTPGGSVWLDVQGNASDLTWQGNAGTTWDLNSAANFSGGNTFYNLDQATFTDSASTGSVVLAGELQPRRVVVSNHSLPYTFSGSGHLAGPMRLEKSGTGTLTIAGSTAHTHSGGTLITGGTLQLANNTAGLGTGLIEIAGGTLGLPGSPTFLSNSLLITGDCAISSSYGGNSTIVNDFGATLSSTGFPTVDVSGVTGILSLKGSMTGFAGTLEFGAGSGMLRLNSGTSPSQDVNFGSSTTHFDLGTAGATLNNRNGDKLIDVGALSGGPGTHLNGRQSGSGNTSTTYRIGALGLDTCFDGTISSAGDLSGLRLEKVGGGRLCLGGNSSYPGSILVEAGTLALPGTLAITGATEVSDGATLELDGGSLETESLHISPGAALIGPGTVHGELTNDGTLLCSAGTLELDGIVVNNGTARLTTGSVLSTTETFYNNGVLDLLTADGTIPPNLINNGIVIDSGGLKLISFGIVGNNVTLTLRTYDHHNYQLQWSDSLAHDSWTDVGSAKSGNGNIQSFTDPGGAGHGARYYRIQVTP